MEFSESNDERVNDVKTNDIQRQDSKESCEDENVEDTNNMPTFDFTEKSWRTDLALIVEGTRLYVAKTILSLASPVFDRMFQSEFKESFSDELELPGKQVEDIREFLRCVYPNTFTQISHDNALKILPLLEEYQVFHLKSRCERVLCDSINEETPMKELLMLLNAACTYNLGVLRKRCVSVLSDKPQESLDEAISKCSPSVEALNELLTVMNVIARGTIKQLEASTTDKSKEIETVKHNAEKDIKRLEDINREMNEELELLKQYLSAEMKRTKI